MFSNTFDTRQTKRSALRNSKRGQSAKYYFRRVCQKHSLHSTASIQTAARQLLEKEILTRNENVYSVYDRFFGLWLQTYYGTNRLLML
jgi:hypothetical protein